MKKFYKNWGLSEAVPPSGLLHPHLCFFERQPCRKDSCGHGPCRRHRCRATRRHVHVPLLPKTLEPLPPFFPLSKSPPFPPPGAGSPVASGRSALPDLALAVVVSGACPAFPCPRLRAMRWSRWSACGLWKVFEKKRRFLDVLWLFVGKGLYQAFNRRGRFIWGTTSAPSRIGSASRYFLHNHLFFSVTMFTCLNELSEVVMQRISRI